MARETIVHDVDLPSLEYDDEETAYMATETPSFDVDDATLGSTFVIVDEDTVSEPDGEDDDDDDDDVSLLIGAGGGTRMSSSASDSRISSTSTAAPSKTKFLDKIREHKSYQKLARIVRKKGRRSSIDLLFKYSASRALYLLIALFRKFIYNITWIRDCVLIISLFCCCFFHRDARYFRALAKD